MCKSKIMLSALCLKLKRLHSTVHDVFALLPLYPMQAAQDIRYHAHKLHMSAAPTTSSRASLSLSPADPDPANLPETRAPSELEGALRKLKAASLLTSVWSAVRVLLTLKLA